jgi:ABC-2 type transport system ATP-binding protein
MLQLSHVTKSFGSHRAVDGLHLTIESGEIFGFLGPNGAGKSTTVNLIVGLLHADSGEIRIGDDGQPNSPSVRESIGLAPQALALYDSLTGRENLDFIGKCYRLSGSKLAERVDWALDFVGLSDRQKDRAETYSGGMKRRLNLAAALLHQPQLLLLDEPTVGVDPQSRNAILERVLDLKKAGCTVLYTSHYMEEVERICDRVGVIDQGKMLAVGTVEELIDAHGGSHSIVARGDGQTEHRFPMTSPTEALKALEGVENLRDFHTERPNLESVFLNLTGRSLRDS